MEHFTIEVNEEAGVMVTTFSRFDDEALEAYVKTAVNHPAYNRVNTRILDTLDVATPMISFARAGAAMQSAAKRSKPNVTMVILAKEELAQGFKRMLEVHSSAAPFNSIS